VASDPLDPGLTDAAGGAYTMLVLQLRPAADGAWEIQVDGTTEPRVVLLAPLTLTVRLWRAPTEGLLRGTLQLQGDGDRWVPFQSTTQLEEVVRRWLLIH
jgi:hypothetical protein